MERPMREVIGQTIAKPVFSVNTASKTTGFSMTCDRSRLRIESSRLRPRRPGSAAVPSTRHLRHPGPNGSHSRLATQSRCCSRSRCSRRMMPIGATVPPVMAIGFEAVDTQSPTRGHSSQEPDGQILLPASWVREERDRSWHVFSTYPIWLSLSRDRGHAVRSLSTPSAACAAASRATGTRYGLQET